MLALDKRSADELTAAIPLTSPEAAAAAGPFDAIIGYVEPDLTLDSLETFFHWLRPGGRLILAAQADPRTLLEALVQAGYSHCLVEPQSEAWTLYRGERPGMPGLAALAALPSGNGSGLHTPFCYIPVEQTPNRPAWRLAPGEKIEWRAPTVLDSGSGQARLLVFSSLVRAVAFMQKAVLADTIRGINKVGKYRSAQVAGWQRPFLVNPTFHDVRNRARGPAVVLEPGAAQAPDE